MELAMPADRADFLTTTRSFLAQHMPSDAVRDLEHAPTSVDRQWWRRGAELGWTALLAPESAGGGSVSGDGLLDLVAIAEALGAAAAPGVLIPQSAVIAGLARSGADAHAELLAGLVDGSTLATWAIHEPGPSWDPTHPATTATQTDAGWVINGVKDRVEATDVADTILVTVTTDAGLAQLLVPADAAGVRVEPMWSVDFSRRFATVTFEGVTVAQSALVGTPGQSEGLLEHQLHVALLLQCADSLGGAQRMFDSAIEWVNNRYSFGRPLASYQALKHRFADMKMWLESCHATTEEAARAVAAGSENAAELVSVAKSYVGRRALNILQECVQMHGGIGLTWEHDLHLHVRRATVNRALYGTPEQHQSRISDLLAI